MKPIKHWTAIGMPYRGLRIGDTLTLEDGHILDVTGVVGVPSSGDTWLYKHPSAPLATRTSGQQSQDVTRHFAWKDYEIWLPLSNLDTDWVYVDPAGTCWRMRYTFTRNGNQFTIAVFCRGRFGVYKLNAPADPVVNVACGSAAFTATYASASAAVQLEYLSFAADTNIAALANVMPSPDGAKAIVNVGNGGGPSESTGAMFQSTVTDIIDIQLSGTGSLAAETFGQGITATVTKIKDVNALFPTYTGQVFSSSLTEGSCCCGTPADPAEVGETVTATGPRVESSFIDFEYDWYQLHWYDADGNLRWIRDQYVYEESTADTYTYSLTGEWEQNPDTLVYFWTSSGTHSASRTKTETANRTMTVGTETVSLGWTATHTGDVTNAAEEATVDPDCAVDLPEPDVAKVATFQTQYNAIAGAAKADETASVFRLLNSSILLNIAPNDDHILVGYNGGQMTVNDPTRTVKASYHPVTKAFSYTVGGLQPQWV